MSTYVFTAVILTTQEGGLVTSIAFYFSHLSSHSHTNQSSQHFPCVTAVPVKEYIISSLSLTCQTLLLTSFIHSLSLPLPLFSLHTILTHCNINNKTFILPHNQTLEWAVCTVSPTLALYRPYQLKRPSSYMYAHRVCILISQTPGSSTRRFVLSNDCPHSNCVYTPLVCHCSNALHTS